ncbi:MAG TPA: hypothetical protein PKW90_09715 [Myxococcota bacterium]|nr:hypothetical protein [Myxococcota bacterium]
MPRSLSGWGCDNIPQSPGAPLPSPSADAPPLHPGMRAVLYMAAVFVLIAGLPLYVFSTETATYFAWKVDPPLTAATLGACYWAAGLAEFNSARARNWTEGRVAVLGVLAFTTLTNLPTFQNMSNYNLDKWQAWVWIATYLAVPPLMGWMWVQQRKIPGSDPPKTAPLPSVLVAGLSLVAVVFLAYGLALLIWPEPAGAFWPWNLNPQDSMYKKFTEPYMGCWLVGLGLVAAQAAREGDYHRNRPVFAPLFLLGVLQAGALVRYGEVLHGGLSAAVWIGGIAFITLLGAAGMFLSPRTSR